ncbi:MAG: hypothetical protein AAF235_02080 [Planctomycetota bacterium]
MTNRSMLAVTAAATTATLVCGPAAAQLIYVDLGGSGNNTAALPLGDTLGNIWNDFNPGSDTELNFADGSGTSGIFLDSTTSSVVAGGNGGLGNPSQALLGDLAVASATSDYLFVVGTSTLTLRLRGLESGLVYDLGIFATRDTEFVGQGTRETLYTVDAGAGQSTAVLQTSGAGAGNGGAFGNNDDLAEFSALTADANGEINITIAVQSGNFGYAGALVLEVVPTPGTAAVLGLGGMLAARRRRTSAAPAA